MTTFTEISGDHEGHAHHPQYETLLAAHREQAQPVLAALTSAGWSDVVLDPMIDCEAPKLPDAVEVTAQVPAGLLGTVPVRARVVSGRAATADDATLLLGGTAVSATPLALLVADTVAPEVTRLLAQTPRLRHLTQAQAGLAG